MGYDLNRFKEEIDDEFICAICTLVLENPVQTLQCEHLYCEKCIKDWLSRSKTCPMDCLPLQLEDLKPALRPLRNLLAKFEIKCDFESSGCNTIVKLEELEHHKKTCKFNPNITVTYDKEAEPPITDKDPKDHEHHEHVIYNPTCNSLMSLVTFTQPEIAEINEEPWQKCEGISISEDNVFRYIDQDEVYVGFAQQRLPLTPDSSYFEMKIIEGGSNNVTVIGVTCDDYPSDCLPGWTHGSIGYHCARGKLHIENRKGRKFGPSCINDDIIRCGIRFPHNCDSYDEVPAFVYFKHNDVLIGEQTVHIPKGGLFPTIGMKSVRAQVIVQTFPYNF